MQVVVRHGFRDKFTGVVHYPGDTLTIDRARYEEITGKLGMDSLAVADAKEPEKKEAAESTATREDAPVESKPKKSTSKSGAKAVTEAKAPAKAKKGTTDVK